MECDLWDEVTCLETRQRIMFVIYCFTRKKENIATDFACNDATEVKPTPMRTNRGIRCAIS